MQKKSVGTREISQTQKSPGNAEALKVVGEEGFEPQNHPLVRLCLKESMRYQTAR
ncbi:hypothetical protein RND59_05795 [Vibrio ruber]|uniref:hypothetical protein n=1 Tax=Vibrio ruber TaxID=184755 RepID=UPI00289373A5|nr:hypothetical protein [Vibrio ruber]WNJ96603.1 hypothetical protein RND59_05795 [Vibrio ruber]